MGGGCKMSFSWVTHDRWPAIIVVVLALVAGAQNRVRAQSLEIPASDYGKVVLLEHESLGNAGNVLARSGAFEAIGGLEEKDPIRQLARAVVRLDVLSEKAGHRATHTCTAILVGKRRILTNHHCLPGREGQVEKASVVFDYIRRDARGAARVAVAIKPIETSEALDYSVLRLEGDPPDGIVPLALSGRRVVARERLIVIQHPAGQIKMMAEYHCRALASRSPAKPELHHSCDTLPGSSGAVVLDAGLHAVALHHAGGLRRDDPQSYNRAVRATSLLAASRTLRAAPASRADAGRSEAARPATGSPGARLPALNTLINQ